MTPKKNLVGIFTLGAVALALPALGEITTGTNEVRPLDRDMAFHGRVGGEERIESDFARWSGSPANADSLVDGLRTGSPITLTGTKVVNGSVVPTSVTFTPPTRPMGNGNVFTALSLARAELAAKGITSPTPQQLETALMGGRLMVGDRFVRVQGVLQLRADGLGWGRIAHVYGFKLGPVIAGMRAHHPDFHAASFRSRTFGHEGGRMDRDMDHAFHSRGVVTAGGTGVTQRTAHSQGIVTAGGSGAAASSGRGIVTASGAVAASGAPATAASRGIVTAGGISATGEGQARGHFK